MTMTRAEDTEQDDADDHVWLASGVQVEEPLRKHAMRERVVLYV